MTVSIRMLLVALIVATLGGAGSASAQTKRPTARSPFMGPIRPPIAGVIDVSPPATAGPRRSTQNQGSAQEWWAAEGRECDGCAWVDSSCRPTARFCRRSAVSSSTESGSLDPNHPRTTPRRWSRFSFRNSPLTTRKPTSRSLSLVLPNLTEPGRVRLEARYAHQTRDPGRPLLECQLSRELRQ